MILFLAGLLVNMKPGRTLQHAKRLVWLALAVLALVLLILTVWLIRRDAVQDHEAGRALDTVQAERRATTNDETREDAREAASAETAVKLETINAEDPDTAVRPASRGDRAVAERLRARSAER